MGAVSGDQHPTEDAPPHRRVMGTSQDSFVRRHATGVTVLLFFGVSAALGALPLPDRFKPVNLSSPDELTAVTARVFKKPRMTFEQFKQPATTEEESEEEEPLIADADERVEEPDDGAAPPPLAEPPALAQGPGSADLAPRKLRNREQTPPTKKVARWRQLQSKLGAPGGEVDNPCATFDEVGCKRTALDPFFAALDAVDKGDEGSHATVVTLGNSLIASDHVTDIARARLVRRFGDGGRGFLLPDRLSKVAGRRVRTGRGTDGWEIITFAQKPPARTEFGFTGSMHESTGEGDRVTWRLRGSTRGRLFYLDHEGNPGFTVEVDGKPLLDIDPLRPTVPEDKMLELELERGSKSLRVVAKGPGVVLYGVALEREKPGVVWDTIGVPASDAAMYVATDEDIFARQLAGREPSLVVVMIGGNEIRSLAYNWTTTDDVRRDYGALIDRVRKATPDAACLAVAPIDAARATAAGAELTTRPEVFDVVALEREIALEKGCAFFDLFAAMGGEGALQRFHRAGLVNDDLVHPKGAGGDVLGNLMADALLASYRATPLPREEVRARRRLVRPELYALDFPHAEGARPQGDERPLARFYERLRALEQGDAQRAAIGVLGGTHVAAEVLPHRVRARLQDRFGNAGRGLIAVGRDDPRLLVTGVERRALGDVQVSDGRLVTMGGAMSLAGHKVRLAPGARFDVTFCKQCRAERFGPRGVLELSWLYTPDMGAADVFVNDVQVGSLSAADRRRDSDVQLLRIPVRGERHALSVQVRESDETGRAGPVNLFTVAADVRRRGVVVDAVGVPGSTGMTMQRWRQDLLAEQVGARRYDLLVFGWGANEAGLADLDEVTYRHHFGRTLETIALASPDASCLVLGPSDRRMTDGSAPPRHELVRDVQRDLAAAWGCGYFDVQRAMGGDGAFAQWQQAGLAREDGVHLTDEGYERLADLLLHDVLALYQYEIQRAEQGELAEGAEAVAAGAADEAAPTDEAAAAPADGRSG
jgi:lysophospholipase L1-like esterase